MNTNKKIQVSVKLLFRCKGKVLYQITDGKIRDIPGGTVKFGETLLSALKRELKEELDYKLIQDPRLLHAWTYISSDGLTHRVLIVYILDIKKQLQFTHKEDLERTYFRWVSKDEIKKQKFLPEMEKFLLKALNFS